MSLSETESTTGPAPAPIEPLLQTCLERIRENDLEGFDDLYRLTRDEVARTLFHLVGRRADLEALVGDVYVGLLEAMRTLPANAPVRPALRRACARVALRRAPLFTRPPPRPSDVPDTREAQAALRLHAALDRLSPKARVVFVFRELLGLSREETAAAAGLSLGALDSHLQRARLELTEALRADAEVLS